MEPGERAKGASWHGLPGTRLMNVCKSLALGVSNAGYMPLEHFEYEASPNRLEFITGGYWRRSSSTGECIASVFKLHNETINIWTHIAGTVIFAYLLVTLIDTGKNPVVPGQPLARTDIAVIGVYILSVIVCFLLSSLYHMLTAGPECIVRFAESADHVGILTLMMGSNFPMIYYGFFNEPNFILFHTATSIGAIALAIGALQFDQFQTRKIYIFLAVVVVGWSQLAHDLYLRGALGSVVSNSVIMVWVRSFSCYTLGVLFYCSKAPESLFPGRFNIFLSSHQLWHVSVLIGALVHLDGCLDYARLARQSLY